jgi:hypothetical protein
MRYDVMKLACDPLPLLTYRKAGAFLAFRKQDRRAFLQGAGIKSAGPSGVAENRGDHDRDGVLGYRWKVGGGRFAQGHSYDDRDDRGDRGCNRRPAVTEGGDGVQREQGAEAFRLTWGAEGGVCERGGQGDCEHREGRPSPSDQRQRLEEEEQDCDGCNFPEHAARTEEWAGDREDGQTNGDTRIDHH